MLAIKFLPVMGLHLFCNDVMVEIGNEAVIGKQCVSFGCSFRLLVVFEKGEAKNRVEH